MKFKFFDRKIGIAFRIYERELLCVRLHNLCVFSPGRFKKKLQVHLSLLATLHSANPPLLFKFFENDLRFRQKIKLDAFVEYF